MDGTGTNPGWGSRMTRTDDTAAAPDAPADEALVAAAAASCGIREPGPGFEGPLETPMGPREFAAFVEEVTVQVSLALAYVGLDETYEAHHAPTERADDSCNDFLPPDADERERPVSFRPADEDSEAGDLPVYVSCASDGVILVCVARVDANGDDEVLFVSPPRSLSEAADLVADVVAAIEGEVPRATRH